MTPSSKQWESLLEEQKEAGKTLTAIETTLAIRLPQIEKNIDEFKTDVRVEINGLKSELFPNEGGSMRSNIAQLQRDASRGWDVKKMIIAALLSFLGSGALVYVGYMIGGSTP
jgi:hypothetical protein